MPFADHVSYINDCPFSAVKAREVLLQSIGSLGSQVSSGSAGSSKASKQSKRGRPRSERKQLDKELFKKRKCSVNQEEQSIERHDFEKEKLETFKKGKLRCFLNKTIQITLCTGLPF